MESSQGSHLQWEDLSVLLLFSELHKAVTAWASNDAKTLTEEYYKLFETDREGLIESDYYLPNSWMHFDGQDIKGKDDIHKFLRSRPKYAKYTFRKITGIAIGPSAMSILIMGDEVIGGEPSRKFAQHLYVSRGRIIVDLFNYFEDKNGKKPKTILDPYNNIYS